MSIGTPCKTVELHITVGDDDLPEDRYSRHVNNARYFVFINRAFHAWYVKMGLRNADAPSGPVMAHTAYDFLRQVNPPGEVVCRITTSKVGRTSLEHSVEKCGTTPRTRRCWQGEAAWCMSGSTGPPDNPRPGQRTCYRSAGMRRLRKRPLNDHRHGGHSVVALRDSKR
jgi:acyl-CoA thioesterase FadM